MRQVDCDNCNGYWYCDCALEALASAIAEREDYKQFPETKGTTKMKNATKANVNPLDAAIAALVQSDTALIVPSPVSGLVSLEEQQAELAQQQQGEKAPDKPQKAPRKAQDLPDLPNLSLKVKELDRAILQAIGEGYNYTAVTLALAEQLRGVLSARREKLESEGYLVPVKTGKRGRPGLTTTEKVYK